MEPQPEHHGAQQPGGLSLGLSTHGHAPGMLQGGLRQVAAGGVLDVGEHALIGLSRKGMGNNKQAAEGDEEDGDSFLHSLC